MANTPIRPQASRSSSRSSSREQDAILDLYVQQQAGRSAITLSAQRSAQSIREASKPPPSLRSKSPGTCRPNVLRKKNRPDSALAENVAPPSTSQRQSLFVPIVPSPLNPDPAKCESAASSRKASEEAHARPPHPKIQHYRSSPVLRITVPELRLPEVSQVKSPDGGGPRLHQPRSVRDLGSDYTRYFNPFPARSNSIHVSRPKNSAVHLAVCSGGLIEPDVSRRLSDPFKDSKRISNPFESALDAECGASPQDEFSPVDDFSPASVRSTAPLRPGTPILVQNADMEKSPSFQYLDDRLTAPYAFPLMTDQKEDDDDLHMPMWDDDIRFKPKMKDHFTRESVVSTFGLVLMLTGLLFVFVVLPVISYTGTNLLDYYYETPLDEMPGRYPPAEPWAWVNDREYPLLRNVRLGLIDRDTPHDAMTRTSVNGETFVLVFSDEFNDANRTFYAGDDPYWFGFEGWYSATNDLEWYDPDAITTGGGTLLLQMDKFRTHDLDFRSGMLNSWNQLCFKGGIFEVSMSLPGPAGKHGLWPGVWTMGNLGRPGYLATTDGLWPYTYSECDAGITSNQSSSDGISYLPGQRLPSCTCAGEDHPTPGKGRGAPEIDIAEISADWGGVGIGVATQSYQVAPFDIWYYPNYDFMENPNYELSLVNTYTGGPYQQAVSTTTMLNNRWYDGQQYQKFAYEYSPGSDENAFVAWTIGDEVMMRFDGRALGPNGNIGQRLISEEPMSMILNLGISNSWTWVDFANLRFPTTLRIDYVRWYQRESEQIVTCDPPGYETTEYIKNHPAAYRNPNFTKWEDAGYAWPRNKLVDECWA